MRIAIILLIIAGVPAAVSAATPVTGCTKITAAGEYVLQNDIINPPATSNPFTCIEIATSDVTFNGNGKKIVGPGSTVDKDTAAIRTAEKGVTKLSNIIVKDADVSQWKNGIIFSGEKASSISGVHSHENAETGIKVESSDTIELSSNIVENNKYGIWFVLTKNSEIGGEQPCYDADVKTVPSGKTNIIKDNRLVGIWLASGQNNQVIDNVITGNGIYKENPNDIGTYSDFRTGITLSGSSNNIIKQNKIKQNIFGMRITSGSVSNQILGNTIDNNHINGIYIGGNTVTGNKVFSNLIRDNYHGTLGAPIATTQSSGNQIYNNWIRKGSGDKFVNINLLNNEVTQFSISPTTGPNILNGLSIGGNYWEDVILCKDYIVCPGDANGDGFKDTAFCTMTGSYCKPGAGQINVDQNPLVAPGNWDKNPVYPQEAGKSCVVSSSQDPPLGSGCWAPTPKADFQAESAGGKAWVYELNPQPIAGYAPYDVQFVDRSELAKKWSWDFGDGGKSTEQNPVHTYKYPGSYDVTLTVTSLETTSPSCPGTNTKKKPGFVTVALNTEPGAITGKSLFSPLTDLWERKPAPKQTLQTDRESGGRQIAASGQDQGFFAPILNLPTQIIMVFTGGPAPGTQNNFGPAASTTGTGDVVPVPQGETATIFLPDGGDTDSGITRHPTIPTPVPAPQVFLPDGGDTDSGITRHPTTPTPVPAPQVFVPIVTVTQDSGAAPIVDVVTPSGGYQLQPGLQPACTAPLTACNGACVDVSEDTTNCGACGNSCPNGYYCSGGLCIKSIQQNHERQVI